MLFFVRNMLLMLCVCIVATGCGSESAVLTAPVPTAGVAIASPAPVPTAGVAVASPAPSPVPTALSIAAPATDIPTLLVVASQTSAPATDVPASPTIIASPSPVPPSPDLPVPTALVAVEPPAPEPSPAPQPSPEPSPVATVDVAVEPVGLRYFFPVQSSGKISYGKYHHDYPATDIFCPIGSEFVAPTSGVVDWISAEDTWDPATDDPAVRGGRSVAIIGDDGVRYYGSHLSAVADGLSVSQRVEAGQVLGLTGNSGDARSTPPHLHFGISHPTTPDDWQVRRGEISPFPYLNAWRNGEMIRPDI